MAKQSAPVGARTLPDKALDAIVVILKIDASQRERLRRAIDGALSAGLAAQRKNRPPTPRASAVAKGLERLRSGLAQSVNALRGMAREGDYEIAGAYLEQALASREHRLKQWPFFDQLLLAGASSLAAGCGAVEELKACLDTLVSAVEFAQGLATKSNMRLRNRGGRPGTRGHAGFDACVQHLCVRLSLKSFATARPGPASVMKVLCELKRAGCLPTGFLPKNEATISDKIRSVQREIGARLRGKTKGGE